ncbi:hypothetical protein ANCCEY_10971 [Ancylostoma ceylanicum]|uniref:Bestrophin homolog n=1 Tax=Ancylostoma ceylanicum TaxID=53326 RepID=A0A0D6LCZ0_9BILA|nr:hypothetical protein ANCCEY_10971 [Ancylostoma ceylanicum]
MYTCQNLEPALQITQAIRGDNERSKTLRRTCIRYLVMTEAMVFRDISPSVRKRFPTMNHLVTSGLMTERELKEYDAVSSPHAKYWLPIQWLLSLVTLARDEGRIQGEVIYVSLLDYPLRDKCMVVFQVGFSVEDCYDDYPPVDRDAFWQIPNPEPLYTAQSAMRPVNPQVGSCVNMYVHITW